MFYNIKVLFIILLIFLEFSYCKGTDMSTSATKNTNYSENNTNTSLLLPDIKTNGNVSLEEALANRRSLRSYKSGSIKIQELSQLLWAGQGISDKTRKFRTAPSAGALYPLKLYVAIGEVSNLSSGLYLYNPVNHSLERKKDTDIRTKIYEAALYQDSIKNAQVVFIITGVEHITKNKYGDRAKQYIYLEAGHAAQNILLQAYTLGLGGVPIGAFYDNDIKKVIGITINDEFPIYIIPVGKK